MPSPDRRNPIISADKMRENLHFTGNTFQAFPLPGEIRTPLVIRHKHKPSLGIGRRTRTLLYSIVFAQSLVIIALLGVLLS